MFDNYNEQGRRSVFFARMEASQFGADKLELEHLLLGILQDEAFIRSVLPLVTVEQIRTEIEAHTPQNERIVPTSHDMPLSSECKAVLQDAAEQADHPSKKTINNETLLWAVLRQE